MSGIDWTAAGVIVTVCGGLFTLLLMHTRTLSRIEAVVRGLDDRASENREDHRALWSQVNRHGETLAGHGSRLTKLEGAKAKGTRMDEAWIEALKALRDDYMGRLNSRIAQPGLSWPETETYLREAMLALAEEIREAEEALRKKTEEDAAAADTEATTRAFT